MLSLRQHCEWALQLTAVIAELVNNALRAVGWLKGFFGVVIAGEPCIAGYPTGHKQLVLGSPQRGFCFAYFSCTKKGLSTKFMAPGVSADRLGAQSIPQAISTHTRDHTLC